VLLLVAASLVGAGTARADGDPASDVLYTGRVFFPYTTKVSSSAQESLVATVAAAEKAGYPIRVALIAGPVDLGAITALWEKPRKYASFLSLELSFVYTGPLLIVMPAGFGFAHYKEKAATEYAALSSLRVAGGCDGLAATAVKAVKLLAARAGHPVTASGSSSGSPWTNRVLAGAIALAFIVASACGAILVRRRLRPGRRA
jgi:hypothetical protein